MGFTYLSLSVEHPPGQRTTQIGTKQWYTSFSFLPPLPPSLPPSLLSLRALRFARGFKNSCTYAASRLIGALRFARGFNESPSVCHFTAYRVEQFIKKISSKFVQAILQFSI